MPSKRKRNTVKCPNCRKRFIPDERKDYGKVCRECGEQAQRVNWRNSFTYDDERRERTKGMWE